MTRFAVVKRTSACRERRVLEAYLPDNYAITHTLEDAFIIGGEDLAGWTLDDYVLPRLGSGLITARELTSDEIKDFVPEEVK